MELFYSLWLLAVGAILVLLIVLQTRRFRVTSAQNAAIVAGNKRIEENQQRMVAAAEAQVELGRAQQEISERQVRALETIAAAMGTAR